MTNPSNRQMGVCAALECDAAKLLARQLCHKHYTRWRRNMDDPAMAHIPPRMASPCVHPGCPRYSFLVKGEGYCELHDQRNRNGKDMDAPFLVRGFGRYVDPDGYVVLTGQQGHIQANANGQMFEHVKVMSEHLGRRIDTTGDLKETVHHRNTVRDDNRVENLEVWCKGQPRGGRVSDQVAWANSVIERYGNDPEVWK